VSAITPTALMVIESVHGAGVVIQIHSQPTGSKVGACTIVGSLRARRPTQRIVLIGIAMGALMAGGLAATRSEHHSSGLYTVISYEPATCTQDLGHSECGAARLIVATAAGAVRAFHYRGNEHPESAASSSRGELYRRGERIEITTSGSTDDVVRIERPHR
jgi:hypothetical protein